MIEAQNETEWNSSLSSFHRSLVDESILLKHFNLYQLIKLTEKKRDQVEDYRLCPKRFNVE